MGAAALVPPPPLMLYWSSLVLVTIAMPVRGQASDATSGTLR
jgi:hypothetical protein